MRCHFYVLFRRDGLIRAADASSLMGNNLSFPPAIVICGREYRMVTNCATVFFWDELIDDDERTQAANDANHIAENLFLIPFLQRLLRRAGEAEVKGAREILLGAIEFARRQQFFGPQNSEPVPQLRPNAVLSTLATIERQIGDARALPAREISEQFRALVVGVRSRMKN